MAIGVHVAYVRLVNVNTLTGQILDKDDPSIPIKAHLNSTHSHRVIEDSAIANTAGNPTVKDYLESEAADNYILGHMDQYMIVTYDRAAINAV